MQWVIESMGNDRYRVANKKLNAGPAHPPGEDVVVEGLAEGPTEWIIKPTDIASEYMYGSTNHKGDAADVLISVQSLQWVSRQQPIPVRVCGTKPIICK